MKKCIKKTKTKKKPTTTESYTTNLILIRLKYLTNSSWQFMDRDVTHKILYGPQLRFGPYTILWVTDRPGQYTVIRTSSLTNTNTENINVKYNIC